MDIRKVKKLIEVLEASNIGEIEIREGEDYIRLTRAGKDTLPFHTSTESSPAKQED